MPVCETHQTWPCARVQPLSGRQSLCVRALARDSRDGRAALRAPDAHRRRAHGQSGNLRRSLMGRYQCARSEYPARILPMLRRCRTGPATNEYDEVRLLHHFACRYYAAVCTHDAGAQRMRFGKTALAAHGNAHRCIRCSDALSTSIARAITTPPPQMKIGLRALSIAAAAAAIARGSATSRPRRKTIMTGLRPYFRAIDRLFMTSYGNPICVAPGRPVVMARNADRNACGTCSARSQTAFHLVSSASIAF